MTEKDHSKAVVKDNKKESSVSDDVSKEDVKSDIKDDVKSDTKDDVKSDIKDDVKSDTKDDVKSDIKDDVKSDTKDDVKSDTKDDVKSDTKDDVKSDTKDDVKSDTKDDTNKKILTTEESQRLRFEIAQKYAKELAKEFKKSLKAVVVYGSTARGDHKETSDIDTFVIIDDTKLENDIPAEVKDRIWADLRKIAAKIDKNITIQAFMFLTEFWESIRSVEPLVMVVLRNGIPVFDVGVFMPAKRMLQRGKLPTTMEAVSKRIHIAPQHLKMAQYRVKSAAHYLEQAMAAAGQAPLMFIGKIPAGKEATSKQLKHYFVEQKLLEQKYVDYADKIHKFAKEMEHDDDEANLKGLGVKVDEHIEICDQFVKRMVELLKVLEQKKKSSILLDTYKTFLRANVGALELKGIKPPEKLKDLPKVMASTFPDLKEQHEFVFEKIAKAMVVAKKGQAEMVPEREIYEIKEDTKRFIFVLGKKLKELKDAGELKEPKGDKSVKNSIIKDDVVKATLKGDKIKDNKKPPEDDIVLERVRDDLAKESYEEKKLIDH
ncbi:MAG: nucleotidyltransferase domain-containing protein [DPANN group archaeon]|nr:nucleotidyltransferase domain-containing protein [DPANN group archaeon]